MKRSRTGQRPGKLDPKAPAARSMDASSSDAHSIDARYGLEPVFEPGAAAAATGAASHADGTQFEAVQCPYCGESFETMVDLSAGSASYIEDCQICCQPIQFQLEVDHSGTLVALAALRGD